MFASWLLEYTLSILRSKLLAGSVISETLSIEYQAVGLVLFNKLIVGGSGRYQSKFTWWTVLHYI